MYDFKMEVTRLQVISETIEIGSDELGILGYAITAGGSLFPSGYHHLGTFDDGDDHTGAPFPLELLARRLPDDDLGVAAAFWMIEEDSGGVRSHIADLDHTFRINYLTEVAKLRSNGFPRGCTPLTAFYRTALGFRGALREAADVPWSRDDAVGDRKEFFFQKQSPNIVGETGESLGTFIVSHAGVYTLWLKHTYERVGPGVDATNRLDTVGTRAALDE